VAEITGAVSPNQVLDSVASNASPMRGQADAFQRLMQAEPPPPPSPAMDGSKTPVAEFIESSEGLFRSSIQEIQDLSRMQSRDVVDIANRNMRAATDVTMVHMQFTGVAAVVQSSKSGLTTLMKNQ
jgi:hypothetical protein